MTAYWCALIVYRCVFVVDHQSNCWCKGQQWVLESSICWMEKLIKIVLGKDQREAQIPFYVFIFIFNSLHVSSTSFSLSRETNCVSTTSGKCHSALVAVSCAGWEWTQFISYLHTIRPPTYSDSYQRLCWHNLSLPMISTMCSKHVEG
jgi:hypothetical protein